MKTAEKMRTGFLLLVIFLLTSALLSSKPHQEQTNINTPDDYRAFMFYNHKTGKMFAKSIDNFTYGLDSAIHEINIAKGENTYYFVLHDMSIEFEIIKYNE